MHTLLRAIMRACTFPVAGSTSAVSSSEDIPTLGFTSLLLPCTARPEFELLGDSLANQQWHRHPFGGHTVGSRSLVLAFSLIVFSSARVGH